MTRAIVNVATTPYYQRGAARLQQATATTDVTVCYVDYTDWPSHQEKPYAFKAYALKDAARAFDVLLWCDSCILPIRSLEPLWERIERDGYWMSAAGFSNYEWTADSAYQDLFAEEMAEAARDGNFSSEMPRILNRKIPHVTATAFGLNVRHPLGKAFLDEYYRLASETRAFCGPWINSFSTPATPAPHTAICGPQDVRGHRHDQTAASVIAWRLGFKLTNPPEIFAYGRADEAHDERTILLADGSYQ